MGVKLLLVHSSRNSFSEEPSADDTKLAYEAWPEDNINIDDDAVNDNTLQSIFYHVYAIK